MKGMKRKVLCSLILGMFLGIFLANQTPKVFAEDTITRGQWMNTLVTTFDMTIEDGIIPDDYYGDITGHEYYDDILIAINFGVVDLEPGEEFRPDDPVTREFAAQTLNYCLGYKLDETVTYTMSDAELLKYPMDAQVAIDRGWFALIDGAFSPETPITAAEKEAMLKDAETVWNSTTIDPEHVSTYTFAEGVIEVTNGTYVEVEDDGTVYIYDTEVVIAEGDTFAVYQNNIALTYNALSVTYDEEKITIETEEVSYDDAVEDCDVEESLDVNLGDFVPADGVTLTSIPSETASTYGLRISDSVKVGGVKLEETVDFGGGLSGKVVVELRNMVVDYKLGFKESYVKLNGDVKTTCSVKASTSKTIPMGMIPIAGVGKIDVSVIISAKGEVSVTLGSDFVVGFQCKDGFRLIKKFSKHSMQIDVSAQASVGVRLYFGLIEKFGPKAYIKAEVGLDGTYDSSIYTDGLKPENCKTIKGWLYAYTEAKIKFFVFDEYEHDDIYDYDNSPCKVCFHIEDGIGVDECTRGDQEKYFTSYKQGTSEGVTGRVSSNAYCSLMTNVVPYTYELDDSNNATITKYNGMASFVNVPSEIDGYTVTKIGGWAFEDNDRLSYVIIPDTVTSIGSAAFYDCDNLTRLDIPDSVIEIEQSAFAECISLVNVDLPGKLVKLHSNSFLNTPITTITVPKSLEQISNWSGHNGVFNGCEALKEIKFEEGITTIPGSLFRNCPGIEEVVIPDTVTTIGGSAFSQCVNLTNIIIPDSVLLIEGSAFYGCIKITKVDIPDSVIEIQGSVFKDCINLIDVDLPNKLVDIADQVFTNTAVTSITIPKSLEKVHNYNGKGPFTGSEYLKEIKFEEGITTIVSNLFNGCPGIEEVTIPDTVTTIGGSAFSGCVNLSDITISDSALVIETSAFYGCKKLTKVDIPDSVIEIQGSVFKDCINLVDVDLPNKLVDIADQVFTNTAVTSITIPKSLETIHNYNGKGPFTESKYLKEIKFEEGITTIPSNLFNTCPGIEEVTIPATVTVIGYNAFYNCTNLSKVTLNEGLKSIGGSTFSGCTSLSEIIIPSTVTTLDDRMFLNCSSLTSVTLPDGITKISDYMFENCTSLTKVNIPDSVETINKYAFNGCSALESVDLSKNVKQIGNYAFNNCALLSDITFSDCLTTIGSYAFRYCNSLESISLPSSIETVYTYAFANCDMLATVDLGAGIKTIPTYCFYENPELTSIILPRQVEKVDSYAFANCAKITDITINKNVTSVASNALSYPTKTTIYGVKGTYAEEFATTYGFTFSGLNVAATGITLNTTDLKLAMDDSYKLIAGITPANSTDDLTFTSTDEEIITVDEDGYIEAVGIGEASVIVMAGDVMVICDITVYQGVSSVYFDSYSYSMGVNEELQLEVTVYPEDAYNKKLIWKSSDESVVTVDENGLVKSVNYGEATITVTAEDGGAYDTCTIYVEDVAVEGITLNTKKITLDPNDTYELVATITPENATNKEIKWTSSNTVVATVENGVITAHGEGTAIIVAKTVDGNKTASCTVTVNPEADKIYVTNISISDTTLSLKKGDTATITATVTPDDATNKTIKWSSSDTRVVTVDNFGKVTAIGTGSATLTCSATDESGVKATCQVTVTTDVKTGWVLENKSWYYYNTDGTYAKGWKQIANKWYYFNTSGVMQTGWKLIGGKWYYLDSAGIMKTGWQKIGGKWYYLANNGVMLTNWQKIGSNWYYLKDGIMLTGWQKIGTKWYYFNASGVMQTGWEKIGTKWYYFNSSGAMLTGWQKIGTKWYYFEAGGAMVTGTKKIGSVTYKFDANGVWIQ